MTEKQFKSGPQFFKGVSGREVTGLFSVFGVEDSYADIMHPGAFAKTFAERAAKTLHLWQHDFESPPIARVVSLSEIPRDALPSEVLAAHPEATGGAEVRREYLDTPRGNEVLAAIKADTPLQMSFGYDAMRYDFEQREEGSEWDRVRHLREVRLWEVSDVLWGANDATLAAKAALAVPLGTLLFQLAEHLKTGTLEPDELRNLRQLLAGLPADLTGDTDSAEPEQPKGLPPLTLLKERLSLLNLQTA